MRGPVMTGLMTALLAALFIVSAASARAQTMLVQGTPSTQDSWVVRSSAELVVLDKVRARPSAVTLKVGQIATTGPLTITVRRCVARPADLPADSAAFIEVQDAKSTSTFRGWMLTNEPSIGQFEHPIYDIRLLACR